MYGTVQNFRAFLNLQYLPIFLLLVETATEDCYSCHIFFSLPRHPVLFLSVAAEKQFLEYKVDVCDCPKFICANSSSFAQTAFEIKQYPKFNCANCI